jgi:uncharacterized protein (TIGR02145 family)
LDDGKMIKKGNKMETKKIILSGVVTIAMAGALYGACTGDLNLGGNYINQLKTQGTDSTANTEEYRAANIKYVRDYVSAYVDGNATLPSGLIKDSEGNIYTTKLFGSKMWMTENLKIGAHTTPNGKTLRVCNATEWATNPTDTFCYATSAANDAAADAGTQLANKGYLYQWNAAMDGNTSVGARGICPSGWHIPSDQEWQTLEGVMSSGSNVPASPTSTGWRFGTDGDGSANGSATSSEQVGMQMKLANKMNVLMAGYRSTPGVQYYQGTSTNFWSSSESGGDAWRRTLSSSDAGVHRSAINKAYGFSVRCVKD